MVKVFSDNIPTNTEKLDINMTLNGEPNNEGTFHLTRRLDNFELRIPRDARGILRVHISALRSDGCSLAQGDLTLKMGYPSKQYGGDNSDILLGSRQFRVSLIPENTPCSISVKFTGRGNKQIYSISSGSAVPQIDCQNSCGDKPDENCMNTGVCTQVFPAGTEVTLQAAGAGESYFNDWFGHCMGRGTCVIDVHGDSTVATAELTTMPACTPSKWCDTQLLPCGGEATAMWMNTPSDILIARKDCGLLRYEGQEKWTRLFSSINIGSNTIRSIWSNSANNIWGAGDGGLVFHISKYGIATAFPVYIPPPISGLIGVVDKNSPIAYALAVANTETEKQPGILLLLSDKNHEQKVNKLNIDILNIFQTDEHLYSIWTDGQRDFWVAGERGALYHRHLDMDIIDLKTDLSKNWLKQITQIDEPIVAIAGTSKDDVWFISKSGKLQHYDRGTMNIIAVDVPSFDPPPGVSLASVRPGEAWSIIGGQGEQDVTMAFHYTENGATQHEVKLPPRVRNWVPPGVATKWQFVGNSDLWIGAKNWNDQNNNLFRRLGEDWSSIPSGDMPNFVNVTGSSASDMWLITDDGKLYHRDESGLNMISSVDTVKLSQAWAQNKNNVWFVGSKGIIYHYDGQFFTNIPSGVNVDIYSIWGTGFYDMWAGGANDTILHWDGSLWQVTPIDRLDRTLLSATRDNVPRDRRSNYYSINGNSSNNVWASGVIIADKDTDYSNLLIRWNGTKWQEILHYHGLPPKQILVRKEDDIWVSDLYDTVIHFMHKDGIYKEIGTRNYGLTPPVLWQDSGGVYISGNNAFTDDTNFQLVDIGISSSIMSIWGKGSELWAVGNHGSILRYRPLSIQIGPS